MYFNKRQDFFEKIKNKKKLKFYSSKFLNNLFIYLFIHT
jgi:hypothetical protein